MRCAGEPSQSELVQVSNTSAPLPALTTPIGAT
jgi:hypothetical protein